MIFSVIIPSYNQEKYIRTTLENVIRLKQKAFERNIEIEILIFDSDSKSEVQQIIGEYAHSVDYVEIKKDNGQYDAINKGIEKCRGDYWTWLNTDDCLDETGFFRLAEILRDDPSVDYIYGDTTYVDKDGNYLFTNKAKPLTLKRLVHYNPGIFQPGSFFKSSFTRKTGAIKKYRCCFDYEYVLRCIKNNAVLEMCNFPVADFRYYTDSKTGMMIPVFLREQLEISRDYGRNTSSFLTWFLHLRLLKHKLFPRR